MESINSIRFNKEIYNYREVNTKFGCVTIASQELNDALLDDDCRFVSVQAEKIDEMIFFYVPPEIFSANEKSISKFLEHNIL